MSGKTVHKDIVPTASAQFSLPPDKLITNLSYSMFKLLVEINDPLKRAFYETECIRGKWSVRELNRQINSLLFERTGLSKDKKKLLSSTHQQSESHALELSIRDPYIFEFLKLKAQEVMGESHLEDSLLDKLQEFILELGHGFCFEARQKRINIGGEYFFVDLVFYHRILKCHVLIELKTDGFKHEYLGQLNTYVSYYTKQERAEGDNPPIGILLCTKKNHALAEYALAGMNNKLFVSKYQVELPKKKEIEKFLEATLKEID
jgi:predicted nuclease of restriction endonuclease-like (RecB) superfamily